MRLLILLATFSVSLVAKPPGGRFFYVANSGSDANDGRTAQTPFRSIGKLNEIDFEPGDHIAFRGGDTFVGHLQLSHEDEGTPANPVQIESYGADRAVLQNADTSTISIQDAGGIVVQQLTLTGVNRTTNRGRGLHLLNTRPKADKRPFIQLKNISASSFGLDGICLAGQPTDSSQSGFENVLITQCDLFDNQYHGLFVTGFWDTNAAGYANKHIKIDHCVAYENTGNPLFMTNHSGSGMEIDDVEDAVIEYCEAYNNGYLCNSRVGGPCGIWLHAANRSVIQYCVAINNRTGRGLDGAGFDLDGGTTNCIIQYCYARDNDGAGILLWNYEQAPHTLENNVLRFNILENNGRRNDYADIYIGSSGTPIRGIQVYNNTIATSQQPRTKAAAIRVTSGVNVGFTFANNLIITNNCLDKDVQPQNKDIVFEGNKWYHYPTQRPPISGVFTSESPQPTAFAQLKGYRPIQQAASVLMGKTKAPNAAKGLRDFAGQPVPVGLVGALAR
ncbi:right-handed parallel beta-helix repeat-containing protein [Fibrella aquatilis]|uniref:Right-handed parallel beta-helix repeat-containing protein n=1 Tax=Fibrella aquatilis TaxID=2817059 RepID=A0A939G5C7_9BACT|nr:right-handed parallel beta-helix repeat-containing protein [Fibrella aquatilis]MBO0930720.1 right-handed parallel beta-helix repeat-containing protein [Fibrella aquatilis]